MQGAEAIEMTREMLGRPRSSADFSPAARYTVSKLCDYAEQERTIDDLRQQLSFLQETLRDAGL